MRIGALSLAILMAVSTSTAAFAQEAKRAKTKPAPKSEAEIQNENAMRLVKDVFPMFLPTPVMLYMMQQKSQEQSKANK